MFFTRVQLPEDIRDVIESSKSYIDKDGNNPILSSCIASDDIEANGNKNADTKWKLTISDDELRKRVESNLQTLRFYKNPISILFE